MFYVISYGRETWSVIFMEEHMQKEFGNRVLTEIFLSKPGKEPEG